MVVLVRKAVSGRAGGCVSMSKDLSGFSGAKRYTVEFALTAGEPQRVRAITPAGETMAVALATARLLMANPVAPFVGARVVLIETDFVSDPSEDAIDYWNTA